MQREKDTKGWMEEIRSVDESRPSEINTYALQVSFLHKREAWKERIDKLHFGLWDNDSLDL